MRYFVMRDPAECWPWNGTLDAHGYGVIGDEKRRQIRAHRIAFERFNGPIPQGRYVLHRCDNPPCCNPVHLFLGTPADNMADKMAKRRERRGSAHPNAKLTEAQVEEIRALLKTGASQQAIADRFGVSQVTVSHIKLRKQWNRFGWKS